VTHKPSGPTGRMEKGSTSDTQAVGSRVGWRKGPQVKCKPSGPTGRMEMEKGPTGIRDTQAVRSHMSDGDGER
jgi:hypothetical protein